MVARVVVAAPASGTGKTTVATGLMAALRAAGLEVSGHKVGPDYIDPGYHAVATGRPGRNLDPHLAGEHRVAPLLRHGAGPVLGVDDLPHPAADVAVVEGVMGLFDGAIGRDGPGRAGYASTAHVARLLRAPVLLVVDASSASRSVAATVHGFVRWDPDLTIGGVVLNRVGSDRHEAEVRAAVESTGVPVLGVLRRDRELSVPSRHLGLVPAGERAEAEATVDRMRAAVAAGVDLAAVVALARSAPPLPGPAWDPAAELAAVGLTPAPGDAPVVAMAAGPVFTFRYAETAELLRAGGAVVLPVDPLRDAELPAGTDALYLGGGFPEVHAAALAANTPMLDAVRAAVAAGTPAVAECAGLLYLCGAVDGHPMAGVLDATAAMTPRLTLGYRTGTAATTSLLTEIGDPVTGHEFHRTAVTPAATSDAAWTWSVDGGAAVREGFAGPRLHASYLHVHWAGHPRLAARFVRAARAFRSERLARGSVPAGG